MGGRKGLGIGGEEGVDLVRESFRAARSAGRRARSRKCDPAQPTTIEVILGSHFWQAAQHYSNGCRLRKGRFFCLWPRAPRPWRPRLPETTPMVVGCARVAFSAPGPALCALAPQLPRMTLGTALRALGAPGCPKWLPSIIPMVVGCAGVAFSAPGPAPRALSAPSCPQLFQWLQAA